MEPSFDCAVCGSPNEVWIDPSQGDEQEFIQDCEICCRPNVVRVWWTEMEGWVLEAAFEE